MFTGVVKLAQIDDYISPSQNCIQPKIMKKNQKEQKATVTLNDCLACSGCITSAQSILIQQMSLQKFKSILSQQNDVFIIMSPQSMVSLSVYYDIELSQLFQKISCFFMTNFTSIKKVFLQTQGIKICHQLIYQEFLQNYKKNEIIICSQCPGWVCYAQKTLPQQIINLMSKIKSPQQIMSRLIKQKYGKNSKVISIMPCFDKKLQAIRFNLEQQIKEVDITLATNEVQNLLKQFPQTYLKTIIVDQKEKNLYNENLLLKSSDNFTNSLMFLEDQASNGYISMLLNRLKAQNIQQKIIKNSDFIEISMVVDGKQVKMAKCYGFRNIQKVVSLIKRKKCEYIYVQIMACPGGCYSGGGQIRYQDKKQKQLVTQFKQLQKPYTKNYSQQTLGEQDFQKIKRVQFEASYKAIEKSFTSTVMNW